MIRNFKVGDVCKVGAVDSYSQEVIEENTFTVTAHHYGIMHVANPSLLGSGWPITLEFNKNGYRIRSNEFYKFKKYIILN